MKTNESPKQEKENIWNVPNALTMLRMALIPVYWVLFFNGHEYEALAAFAVASLTDLADGYIARKYNLITNFGKLMDPLADKLMSISVMLSMVIKGVVPWPILLILLLKEGFMVVGGIFPGLAANKSRLPAAPCSALDRRGPDPVRPHPLRPLGPKALSRQAAGQNELTAFSSKKRYGI